MPTVCFRQPRPLCWRSGDSACRSWFDIDAVERLVNDHESGAAVRYDELWSLLVFETWHGVFIGDSVRAPQRAAARRSPSLAHANPVAAAG